MPTIKELGQIFLKESQQVVESTPQVLGFLPVGDERVLFLSKEQLSESEREAIIKKAPRFANVYFLAGVNEDTYREDPSIVQRALFYDGMLPGWRMCKETGKWVNRSLF